MVIAPAVPAAAARATGSSQVASQKSFGAVLESRLGAHPRPELAKPADKHPNPLLEGMKRIEQAQRRMDAVLQAAQSGRTFTAQELLSIQTQVYRFAQTVDLASKLVEQGVQSVKQAMNTQV